LSPRLLSTTGSFAPPSSSSTAELQSGRVRSSFVNAAGQYDTQQLHDEWKKIITEFSDAMVGRTCTHARSHCPLSPSLLDRTTALMLTIIECDASQRAAPTVARTAIVVMLLCAQRCGSTCASVRQFSFAMRAVRAAAEGRVELRGAVADGTGGFCGGIATPSSAAAS